MKKLLKEFYNDLSQERTNKMIKVKLDQEDQGDWILITVEVRIVLNILLLKIFSCTLQLMDICYSTEWHQFKFKAITFEDSKFFKVLLIMDNIEQKSKKRKKMYCKGIT